MRKSEVENLIYVALRFKPDAYGITLDRDGWTKIDDLIYKINFLHGATIIDRSALFKITKRNPKFTTNLFKTQIKANKFKDEENQLTLKRTLPPDTLYCVLNEGFVFHSKQIIKPCDGDKFVVLKTVRPGGVDPSRIVVIDSRQMLAAGYSFYLAHNGDILIERVPCKFAAVVGGV